MFGCGLVYLAALRVNAVTVACKGGRGSAEVARGRVRRVELTGGEATRGNEAVSKVVLATQAAFC